MPLSSHSTDSARIADVNGFIEIPDNPLSKAGVYEYPGRMISNTLEPNKMYSVYRPAEELSDPECIESFKLIPWIDGHVMLGSEEIGLTPAEQKGISGVIGEQVYFKDGTLYGNIKLYSENLADAIDSGLKKELSAGYRCKYKITSGVFQGRGYDVVQHTIRGNHLASVPQGRMGPDVAVLDELSFTFDAKDFKMADETEKKEETKTETKAGGEGESEMTLAEAVKMLKEIVPQVKAMNDHMAKVTGETDKTATDADTKEDDGDTKEGKGMDAKFTAAMDAANTKIGSLETQIADFKKNGVKSIMGEVRQRDALAARLSNFVGAFDAADKTLDEVAVYGAEKLGLKGVSKGQELAAVEGFLFNRQAPSKATQIFAVGMDAASTNEVDDFIAGKKAV